MENISVQTIINLMKSSDNTYIPVYHISPRPEVKFRGIRFRIMEVRVKDNRLVLTVANQLGNIDVTLTDETAHPATVKHIYNLVKEEISKKESQRRAVAAKQNLLASQQVMLSIHIFIIGF